jgi:hypothetical protein
MALDSNNPRSPIPDPRSPFLNPRSPFFESSFSLLINAPGLYKLKGTLIEAKPCHQYGGEAEKGFYASLPLVLRPGCRDDFLVSGGRKIAWAGLPGDGVSGGTICAEDRFGPAAFFCSGGPLFGRDDLWQNASRRDTGPDIFCIVKGNN